jgi:hypothetical protein
MAARDRSCTDFLSVLSIESCNERVYTFNDEEMKFLNFSCSKSYLQPVERFEPETLLVAENDTSICGRQRIFFQYMQTTQIGNPACFRATTEHIDRQNLSFVSCRLTSLMHIPFPRALSGQGNGSDRWLVD